MISKKVLLEFVCISVGLIGCKDFGWRSGDSSPSPGRGAGASPVVTLSSSVIPYDADSLGARLVVKNNAQYKFTASMLQRLNGIVPALVKQATDEGLVAADSELSVSVAMKLHHEIELDKFLKNVYDPKSPDYRHFLSAGEFIEQFSPTKSEVEQVQNLLERNGFKSISVDPNRLLVHAKGSAEAIAQVFYTEIHNFKDRTGQAFYAPSYEVQVPLGFSIQAVHGLDNVVTWHNHLHRLPDELHSARGKGLTPTEIISAYSIPAKLNGKGQRVALFELDGYNPSDILGYQKEYGISPAPLKNILLAGATGHAGNAALEVVLDIELVTAVAPGVKEILVYQGPNSEQGVLSTYNRIANDNEASIVSVSWGAAESSVPTSFIQTESAIFKQMAAQGQAIYVASGDNGAYDDGVNLGINDPSGQPYAVAVGGTRLTLNSEGSYRSETSWNTNGGGGGGISDVWTQPSWQAGMGNSQNQVSNKMRNVPDVSLNSDPQTGYSVYFKGGWITIGGTSAAAPLWAAFHALVDEQRSLNGLARLGFPNGELYQLGKSESYSQVFHDIADDSTNLFYPAVTGYDASTGWGSMNGAALLNDLAGAPTPAKSRTLTAIQLGRGNRWKRRDVRDALTRLLN